MTVCVYHTVLFVLSYPHISVTASHELSSRVGSNTQEKDNNEWLLRKYFIQIYDDERSSGKGIGPPWI